MEPRYITIREYPSRLTLYADTEPMLRISHPSRVESLEEADTLAGNALMMVLDRCQPCNTESLFLRLRDIYCRMIA